MVTFISNSPGQTFALGENCASLASVGSVFALQGDLGAGKTQWMKGFARGLGFSGRVLSPTFALMQTYMGGRHTLFHLDLYRLTSQAEIVNAGLDEYLFQPQGVTVVEWPERWFGEGAGAFIPRLWRCFRFVQTADLQRRITYDEDP